MYSGNESTMFCEEFKYHSRKIAVVKSIAEKKYDSI